MWFIQVGTNSSKILFISDRVPVDLLVEYLFSRNKRNDEITKANDRMIYANPAKLSLLVTG